MSATTSKEIQKQITALCGNVRHFDDLPSAVKWQVRQLAMLRDRLREKEKQAS